MLSSAKFEKEENYEEKGLSKGILQGVPTLSDKSNFDVTARKFGQISKVKVFSCSQMKNNLF